MKLSDGREMTCIYVPPKTEVPKTSASAAKVNNPAPKVDFPTPSTSNQTAFNTHAFYTQSFDAFNFNGT